MRPSWQRAATETVGVEPPVTTDQRFSISIAVPDSFGHCRLGYVQAYLKIASRVNPRLLY